jgi:hypothetical protein
MLARAAPSSSNARSSNASSPLRPSAKPRAAPTSSARRDGLPIMPRQDKWHQRTGLVIETLSYEIARRAERPGVPWAEAASRLLDLVAFLHDKSRTILGQEWEAAALRAFPDPDAAPPRRRSGKGAAAGDELDESPPPPPRQPARPPKRKAAKKVATKARRK